MFGLFLGKFVGIVGLFWFVVKFKIGKFLSGMNNFYFIIVGLFGGIGFTMCLFFVEMVFVG